MQVRDLHCSSSILCQELASSVFPVNGSSTTCPPHGTQTIWLTCSVLTSNFHAVKRSRMVSVPASPAHSDGSSVSPTASESSRSKLPRSMRRSRRRSRASSTGPMGDGPEDDWGFTTEAQVPCLHSLKNYIPSVPKCVVSCYTCTSYFTCDNCHCVQERAVAQFREVLVEEGVRAEQQSMSINSLCSLHEIILFREPWMQSWPPAR